MQYEGITAQDLANVTALNHQFLRIVGDDLAAAIHPSGAATGGLRRCQRARLAAAPVLLFSIGENDPRQWSDLGGASRDLFGDPAGGDAAVSSLGIAAAAFAWYLAQHNVYALRMLYGARREWVDQVGDANLIDVMDHLRHNPQIVTQRASDNLLFWTKLLGPGLSDKPEVRHAARIAAVQSLFTRAQPAEPAAAWPVAACRFRKPGLRVADKPAQSGPDAADDG